MRKVRSQAPAPVSAVMSEDFASRCATEGLRALKQDLGAQQAASSNHQGESDLKSQLHTLVQSRNSQPYTDMLHSFLQSPPTEQERDLKATLCMQVCTLLIVSAVSRGDAVFLEVGFSMQLAQAILTPMGDTLIILTFMQVGQRVRCSHQSSA